MFSYFDNYIDAIKDDVKRIKVEGKNQSVWHTKAI